MGLHHQKPISAVRFWFSSPKTRTNQKISRFQPKFPDLSDNFPESGEETQILAIFPLDPVRFWPNLAKSHQTWWDFRWIWRNLIRFKGNLTGIWKTIVGIWVSSSNLCFFHRFLVVFVDLWLRPTSLPPVDGLNRPTRLFWQVGGGCIFFPPDFGGSVSGWAQTRPEPTRGQP